MENTNEEVVVDTTSDTETKEDGVETVSIPKTDYDKLNQDLGSLKRELKDLKKSSKETKTETKEETPEPKTETKEFGLGEKAYLIANGIKEADEMDLVRKLSKETGKDVETLLGTTYFQTELSTFRTQKAIPDGGKRAQNTSVDSVEYWLAKGELPPKSEVELRRKVVNARMKSGENKEKFYNS